jgi:hypothetical protein
MRILPNRLGVRKCTRRTRSSRTPSPMGSLAMPGQGQLDRLRRRTDYSLEGRPSLYSSRIKKMRRAHGSLFPVQHNSWVILGWHLRSALIDHAGHGEDEPTDRYSASLLASCAASASGFFTGSGLVGAAEVESEAGSVFEVADAIGKRSGWEKAATCDPKCQWELETHQHTWHGMKKATSHCSLNIHCVCPRGDSLPHTIPVRCGKGHTLCNMTLVQDKL